MSDNYLLTRSEYAPIHRQSTTRVRQQSQEFTQDERVFCHYYVKLEIGHICSDLFPAGSTAPSHHVLTGLQRDYLCELPSCLKSVEIAKPELYVSVIMNFTCEETIMGVLKNI